MGRYFFLPLYIVLAASAVSCGDASEGGRSSSNPNDPQGEFARDASRGASTEGPTGQAGQTTNGAGCGEDPYCQHLPIVASPGAPTVLEQCAELKAQPSDTVQWDGQTIQVACVNGTFKGAVGDDAIFGHELVQTYTGEIWMEAMPQGMLFTLSEEASSTTSDLVNGDAVVLLVTRISSGDLHIVRLQRGALTP
jgi:hypothetical protein